MLVPAPRPTLGPGRAAVSRRALLAAAPLIALGGRARPARADTPLAMIVPDHLDLTQTFEIARARSVPLDDLAARFDNTPDAAFQLARLGYVDGYERIFESDDAIGNDVNLVSLLYLRFAEANQNVLTDAAYLLANDRAMATQLKFARPESIPFSLGKAAYLKLAGPSGSGTEITYYGAAPRHSGRQDTLIRLLTVSKGDAAADAMRLMSHILDHDCECDFGPGDLIELPKLGPNDGRWLAISYVPEQDVFFNTTAKMARQRQRQLVFRFRVFNIGLAPAIVPLGVNNDYLPGIDPRVPVVRLVDARQRLIEADPDSTREFMVHNVNIGDSAAPIPEDANVTYALVFDLSEDPGQLTILIGDRKNVTSVKVPAFAPND